MKKGAVARIILKDRQSPKTGGCERIASIRLAFFTSDVNFQRIHVNEHPASFEAFIQLLLIDGVCSFSSCQAGFFSYQSGSSRL